MPVSAVLNRVSFVEWLGGSHVPRASAGVSSARHRAEEIVFVWDAHSGPPSLKNVPVISVAKQEMRDFFAFTSTYVATYTPFSAFFRVVPDELLHQMLNRESAQKQIPEELVGVAIAEAYIQTGGSIPIEKLSIQACLATVSSSIIAAVSNGYETSHLDMVLSSWALAREFLVLEQPKIGTDAVAPFWMTTISGIYGATTSNSTYDSYNRALAFIRQQIDQRFLIDPSSWRELTRDFPESVRALADEKFSARRRASSKH